MKKRNERLLYTADVLFFKELKTGKVYSTNVIKEVDNMENNSDWERITHTEACSINNRIKEEEEEEISSRPWDIYDKADRDYDEQKTREHEEEN